MDNIGGSASDPQPQQPPPPPQPAKPQAVFQQVGKAFLAGIDIPAAKDPVRVEVRENGRTAEGIGVFYPVIPFSIDDWRKAGSPQ